MGATSGVTVTLYISFPSLLVVLEKVLPHLFPGPPMPGTVVFTQLSIAASGLSGVPLGLKSVNAMLGHDTMDMLCPLSIYLPSTEPSHGLDKSLEFIRFGQEKRQMVLRQCHRFPQSPCGLV